jgi:hypothetical protein
MLCATTVTRTLMSVHCMLCATTVTRTLVSVHCMMCVNTVTNCIQEISLLQGTIRFLMIVINTPNDYWGFCVGRRE